MANEYEAPIRALKYTLKKFSNNLSPREKAPFFKAISKLNEQEIDCYDKTGVIIEKGKPSICDEVLEEAPLINPEDMRSQTKEEGEVKLTGIGYVVKTKDKGWATSESLLKKYVGKKIKIFIEVDE